MELQDNPLRDLNNARNLKSELDEEMKWHHRTHAELVQTQCKLLDMERELNKEREELRAALQDRHDFHWALKDAQRERDEARELADSYRIALCSANGTDKAPNPFPWEER